ncbi:unnamed protein product [Clonostachys rhizophaga]|uniref:F-box domain-containing protein n=1 Tax=Clonostachys rhizophaga TaxID=160324 RepID=A0A9N9YIH7_9HYPO|nr:unnamed protein product [Clonostachys rhizophaga]
MDIFARSFTLLNIQPNGRSLERLPQEILRRIVEHEDLETQDRKAISLTCSTLRSHALPSLFRCITISQLWQDRENFLRICHTPHLAQHVRDIEWQEISWHPGFFSRAAFYSKEAELVTWLWCWYYNNSSTRTPGLYGRLRAGDQGAQLAFCLDESLNRHFWLFAIPDLSSSVYPFTCEEMCGSGFSPEEIDFIKGRARQFSEGLAEFDSATFNSLREKAIASFHQWILTELYALEIRARHFQTHRTYWLGVDSQKEMANDETDSQMETANDEMDNQKETANDEADSQKETANDGLFLFLFPAMERLRNRITRLLWHDEDQYRSCTRPVPRAEKVFEHLQKLELSFYFPHLMYDSDGNERNHSHSLLRAATNLTHLVINSNLRYKFYLPSIRSTQLVSLHLHSSARVTCKELIPVLQRNSKTLRHLGLDSCALVVGSLNRIREEVPDLQLESCRLMGASQSQDWVPESHVLDYMNRHGSQDHSDSQRENFFEWRDLLFKRNAIFTEDDLMGASCWKDSEDSEDSNTTEERDYEFSEGSAADYWFLDEVSSDEIEDAEMSRYSEALQHLIKAREKRRKRYYAHRNNEASEVDEGPEAEDMEMDENCDSGNCEGGELNDPQDSEMLDDEAGKGKGQADEEHETSGKEEREIDVEEGCADDEMEEDQCPIDEEMDVEDCGSTMSSIVDRKFRYADLVDEDSDVWVSSRSEYMSSSEGEGEGEED